MTESEAPESASNPDSPDTGDDGDYKSEAEKWKALARKHEQAAKANAGAAKQLAEIADRDKSDQQKLAERAEAAEKRAAEVELRALRHEVALAKGLTSSQAKRLVGSTEAELLADADELLSDIKSGRPPVDVDQGVRGDAAKSGKPDMNTLIRSAAGRS